MDTPSKTTIENLDRHVGQAVTLSGWVYKTRASGKIAFIIVRDGTGLCQCVLEKSDETQLINTSQLVL